jgi:hypothetical protein
MAWLGWESGKTKDGSIGQGEYLRIVKKFQEKLLTAPFVSSQCERIRLPWEYVSWRPVRGVGSVNSHWRWLLAIYLSQEGVFNSFS